jgi:glycosyltransferase involved in cell wall biosynthesis
MNKVISIVTPCFNEEENVEELSARVALTMKSLPYEYEHIFIDNCSTDNTVDVIKSLIEKDKHIRLIVNLRNFGQLRSPVHVIRESSGDATIFIVSDLQDPPELITDFIEKWEAGYKVVLAVKSTSDENKLIYFLRRIYYSLLAKISEVPLIENATGAGLVDREVVKILREINDPIPYYRGLLAEIGYPIATVEFNQPRRVRGVTKNNFLSLYDIAILGITTHSKTPLRLITMTGFAMSLVSIIVAIYFLFYKLLFWNSFSLGIAPVLIGLFFFSAVQLFFIGIIGEYIGSINTKVRSMPLVYEKERINFEIEE